MTKAREAHEDWVKHAVYPFETAPDWLRGKERNDFSQFGEDGLVQAIFEHMPPCNKWCFEIGADDGWTLSNTRRLIIDGWRAVLIEKDAKKCDRLREKDKKSIVITADVGVAELDSVLSRTPIPADADFGCIDIDGQDFWMWAGLQQYRPRVMLVEYSPYGNSPENRLPGVGEGDQAGINRIRDLGIAKGYIPLVRTYCNVLFVRADVWDLRM